MYYFKQIQLAKNGMQNCHLYEQHSITATKHATYVFFFFLKKYATYVIILINQNWKEKGSPKKKKAHPLTVGS